MRRTLWLLLLILALPLRLSAQTAQGRVIDAATRQPIAGAHVVLLDEQGARVRGTLTNAAGRFQLVAATGRYRLRAEMIGRNAVTLSPLEYGQGVTHEVVLELPVAPINLGALDVRSSKRCELRAGTTNETQTVWEEARKALAVEQTVREEGLYHFEITQYERETTPQGIVSKEQAQFASRFTGSPFVSRPPEQLAARGYYEMQSGAAWLFAPNSDVLLSESFLDTHCFYLRRGDGERGGQVGLVFEPVRGRRLTDIEGVLWLSERTAELLTLEFRYVNTPASFPRGEYGGNAQFRRLPGGVVIVHTWHIVSPIVQLFEDQIQGRVVASERIAGMHATGGEVIRIADRSGSVLEVTPRAVFAGLVYDSTLALPVDSAEVFLVGTNYRTRSGADGRFRLENLPPGRYAASFRSLALEQLGFPVDTVTIELERARITDLVFAVPKHARAALTVREARRLDSLAAASRHLGFSAIALQYEAAARLNRDTLPTGLVTPVRMDGRVVDHGTGLGVLGALVRIAGTPFETLADREGRFRFENVPPGSYQIVAEHVGYLAQQNEIRVEGGRSLDVTIRLPSRPIALDTIAVTARLARLSRAGFYERQRESGLSGFYITRDDIEKRNSPYITDLIDDSPGARVMYAGPGKRMIRFNRGVQGMCEPSVYIDDLLYQNKSPDMNTTGGLRWENNDIRVDNFDVIPVAQIEGVEVYVGAATPTKYNNAMGCGVILIWTR